VCLLQLLQQWSYRYKKPTQNRVRVRLQRSKAVTAIWNQLSHVQLIITHFAHGRRGGKDLEDLYLDMWALPHHCTKWSYEKNAPLWVPYHAMPYYTLHTIITNTKHGHWRVAIEKLKWSQGANAGSQVACWVFCKSCCPLAFMLHFQMLVGWCGVAHTHTHTHTHAGDTDKMGTRQTGFAMQARAFGFNWYEKQKSSRPKMLAGPILHALYHRRLAFLFFRMKKKK